MTKEELQSQLAEIARQEKEELSAKNLEFAEQYKDVKYLLEAVFRETYTCYTLLCVNSVEPQPNNPTYAVYIKGGGFRLDLNTRTIYDRGSMFAAPDSMGVSIGERNKDEIVILTKEQYDMLLETYKNIAASYEKQFKSFLNCLQNDQL